MSPLVGPLSPCAIQESSNCKQTSLSCSRTTYSFTAWLKQTERLSPGEDALETCRKLDMIAVPGRVEAPKSLPTLLHALLSRVEAPLPKNQSLEVFSELFFEVYKNLFRGPDFHGVLGTTRSLGSLSLSISLSLSLSLSTLERTPWWGSPATTAKRSSSALSVGRLDSLGSPLSATCLTKLVLQQRLELGTRLAFSSRRFCSSACELQSWFCWHSDLEPGQSESFFSFTPLSLSLEKKSFGPCLGKPRLRAQSQKTDPDLKRTEQTCRGIRKLDCGTPEPVAVFGARLVITVAGGVKPDNSHFESAIIRWVKQKLETSGMLAAAATLKHLKHYSSATIESCLFFGYLCPSTIAGNSKHAAASSSDSSGSSDSSDSSNSSVCSYHLHQAQGWSKAGMLCLQGATHDTRLDTAS